MIIKVILQVNEERVKTIVIIDFFDSNHPVVLYNNKVIYSVETQHTRILVLSTIMLSTNTCCVLTE